MGMITNLLLCSFVVVVAPNEVDLMPDRPFQRAELNKQAILKCCTRTEQLQFQWVKRTHAHNVTLRPENVTSTDRVNTHVQQESDQLCGTLTIKSVELGDSGLYQCVVLNHNSITHGTYLQVYTPLGKTINLSEKTKNKILTAEGILLLLCVLLPATTLLCQSKKLSDLERKKGKKEEENIYQGLNLDDCSSAYDQIERSQAHGPYQDVCNVIEEEEEIQLEKP